MKRRASEEIGPQHKKHAIIAGPWDLEIPTNVIMFERPPSLLPHPHPEVIIVIIKGFSRFRC